MYYGISKKEQVVELAQMVCKVIDNRQNNLAVALLVETCAAETLLGTARDNTPYAAGTGISQVDSGTFYWLRTKYKDSEIAKRLLGSLSINLGLVQYKHLEHSPILGLVFARLRYWTVPAPIPKTLKGRAAYWKEHYNTIEGKGSSEEYMTRCKVIGDLLVGVVDDK